MQIQISVTKLQQSRESRIMTSAECC